MSPLCVPLGRPSFGLPYRSGHLVYQHDHAGGGIEGAVRSYIVIFLGVLQAVPLTYRGVSLLENQSGIFAAGGLIARGQRGQTQFALSQGRVHVL